MTFVFHHHHRYDQTRSMVRATLRPLLLLELGASVPDDSSDLLHANLKLLQGRNAQGISINDLASKLVLLLHHFPTLRLLWSLEPIYSIEYFEKLSSMDLVGTPFSQQMMTERLFSGDMTTESEGERDLSKELASNSLQVFTRHYSFS